MHPLYKMADRVARVGSRRGRSANRKKVKTQGTKKLGRVASWLSTITMMRPRSFLQLLRGAVRRASSLAALSVLMVAVRFQ